MSRKPTDKKELRTTSKGTTYWYYPESAERTRLKKKKERAELIERSGKDMNSNQWNTIHTSVNVIKLDSKKDPHYLRYIEKKKLLREEYDRWSRMNRDEWLDYYQRLSHLLFHDEDFQHYFKEVKKTYQEKAEDDWWEKKKEKDEDYDGHLDEYAW